MAQEYNDILKNKRVETECPRCYTKYNTPITLTENKQGIDDAKCSKCFREDFVFVNLVRVIPIPDN